MKTHAIVYEIKTKAVKCVVAVLDKIFLFVCIPSILKNDDGPPFND